MHGRIGVLGEPCGDGLAQAFAASGAEVLVWNRTSARAEALVGSRVALAASATEAFASSPLTIVSVSDHELARALVEEGGPALAGAVVASTSFVTPDQGRALDGAVTGAGGRYLDLSIPAYPSEVRSGSGVYLVSGERADWEASRERLERIGRVSYVDEAPGAAYVSEMAVLLAYLPMAVGLLQGQRICELHDLPLDWFKETVLELYPFHLRARLERATTQADGSATSVEASVDVWGEGAREYADYLRELGLDAGLYDAVVRLFDSASAAGHGADDWIGIARYTVTG